jgi:hypothetical protein
VNEALTRNRSGLFLRLDWAMASLRVLHWFGGGDQGYSYFGPNRIGTVSANETRSSIFFTASVHRPHSVLPPLPSMTSGIGKGRGVFRLSLKRAGALAVGATTGGAGGLSSGVASVASGRMNNLLNIVESC